jgi:hypothetical protein
MDMGEVNMKRLVLKPNGWKVPYMDCPPGLFVTDEGTVGLRTEYGDEGYCDSGEAFCSRDKEVTPVIAVWEDYE